MTRDEFKNAVEAMRDPDKAPEALVGLLDFYEEVSNGRQDLENRLKNSMDRISELQGTAARLAQRVTGGRTGDFGGDEGAAKEPTEEELAAEGRAYFAKLGEEV